MSTEQLNSLLSEYGHLMYSAGMDSASPFLERRRTGVETEAKARGIGARILVELEARGKDAGVIRIEDQAPPANGGMTTGTAKELHSLFKPQAKSSAGRVAQRRAVVDAQVNALESCIEDIRRKVRETPAWAHGLNSAVTSIELQIAALKANR